MENMTTAPIILVADRNEDAAEYLRQELARTDYELLHAKDGHEVLSIMDTSELEIAFAVIELELPVVNGLSLIGKLSTRAPRPGKIIATTFLNDDIVTEIATRMGADAVLQKPLPQKTWVGQLRRLLPKPTSGLRASPCLTRGRPPKVGALPKRNR